MKREQYAPMRKTQAAAQFHCSIVLIDAWQKEYPLPCPATRRVWRSDLDKRSRLNGCFATCLGSTAQS
ncbi:MAG: hypothetical protein LUQ34_01635, partial [Euryarchaeota archaeon]|nr:hypothetical protein [Euryarchaeota archaeon]